jgi:kynurenine formamidase
MHDVNSCHSFYESGRFSVITDEAYEEVYQAIYADYLNEYIENETEEGSEENSEEEKQVEISEELAKAADEYAKKQLSGYIKVSELKAMGIDVSNVYHWNSVSVHTCFVCGLKYYDIEYYTYTAEEECKYHSDCYYTYAGNADYQAFTALEKSKKVGHYAPSVYEEKTLSELVTIATNVIGTLPFTPTRGSSYAYYCQGCGKLRELAVYLRNGSDELNCYIYYKEDGTVSNWNYSAWVYELDFVQSLAGEYYLSETTSGHVWLGGSPDGLNIYIYMNLENGDTREVDLYSDKSMVVYDHEHAKCWTTRTRYNYDEETGAWVEKSYGEYEDHHYSSSSVAAGENCKEDGRYVYASVCSVCNDQKGEDYEIVNYHAYWHSSYVTDVQNIAYKLTAGKMNSINGLNAQVYVDDYCNYCNTILDCIISLQDNWTLTRDVYLKADGITFDFNGYTVDLNGYKLILYGYSGSNVVITDNSFDTSEKELNDQALKDSGEGQTGMIILGTNGGSVTVGCIAVNVTFYLSDHDTRDTLVKSAEESVTTAPSEEGAEEGPEEGSEAA